MRKIISKIAGTLLGLSLAVGVGAAVGGAKKAQRVNADEPADSYGDWAKVSSTSDLAEGDKIAIVTNTNGIKYMGITTSSGHFQGITFDTNVEATDNGIITLESTGTADRYKLASAGSTGYATASKAGSGGGQFTATDSDGWNFSYTDGAWNIIYSKEYSSKYANLRAYNGTFRTYEGKSNSAVYVYKYGGEVKQKLASPSPVFNSADKEVTWAAVTGATGYEVKVDEGSYSAQSSPFDVSGLTADVEHTVYVVAKGDGSDVLDSDPGSVKFTIDGDFTPSTFELVTDVSDLETNVSYIITSGITGSVKTMKTEANDNNRKSTDVSVIDSKISSTKQTLTFTLGGSSGAWTLFTDNYLGSSNGYLASALATSTDKNYLRVTSTENTATISFGTSSNAEIVLTPHGTRNLLSYNTSGMFACYSGGQGDVYLWKEASTDTLSSIEVTGSMTKTTYNQNEAWSPAGLTVNGYYESAPSTPVDITDKVSWSYSPETTASLETKSVVATASYKGKSASSTAQAVTINKVNPIQALYSLSNGASVTDIYGYFVGKIDNSNIVIMDGEWGIDLYTKDAFSDIDYVENETILKVSGSISIYNGFYEIVPTSTVVSEGGDVETPVVYAAQGGETANYCSRITTVSGVPTVSSGDITKASGVADLTLSFALGGDKTIPVFYHRNSQVAADYAKIQEAVNESKAITVKGFTAWYQSAIQIKMNGVIDEASDYTAAQFSQDLLNQTDAVCALVGEKTYEQMKTALTAIWSDLASTNKYPSLPSAQKTILAEAERDEEGSTVEQAMARYDQLTGKYQLNNFINGRTPVAFAPSSIEHNTNTNTSASTIIIVVVALTSITSIGVLLVIKRKRSLVK